MPLLNNVLFDQLLIPAVFLFFLVSGVSGVALGIGLIVFRSRVFRLIGPMNRWVSARKTLKPIEESHDLDRFVHRYRYWFSAIFILGGAFSIFILVTRMHVTVLAAALGASRFSVLVPVVIQSLGALLIVGSVLAVAVGVILGFFPRALAVLEKRMNLWVSSRRIARGVDDPHLPLDRWFQSSPRVAGCVLTVAALILTVNSAVVLIGRH